MKTLKAIGIYLLIVSISVLGGYGCGSCGRVINGGGSFNEGLNTSTMIGVIIFMVLLFVVYPICAIRDMMGKK